MPTKKRRVGFIPRNDVLEIINKLSYETNLSYSKIINILVEEALYKRGLFNVINNDVIDKKNIDINEKLEKIIEANEKFQDNVNHKRLKENKINFKEVKDCSFDDDIYAKFLMFLQFQERMKKEI